MANGGMGSGGGFGGLGGGGLGGMGGGSPLGDSDAPDERDTALEKFKPVTGEFTNQAQAPSSIPQQQAAAPQTQIKPLDEDELTELQQFLQPTREFGQSLEGSGTRAINQGLQFLGDTQQGLGGAGF